MSKVMKGLRLVGVLAMALVITHCGDSDVRVTTGPGVAPSPGTFTGALSDGGSIRLEVGSIEEIEFDCDSETIRETFTPPKQVDSDGTFDIGFSDGGRQFHVQGTFRDNNTVDGTINDEDNECDVTFDAVRGGPALTPTPARTPTNGGPTPTVGEGTAVETETPVEPTSTDGVTPTGPTPTGPSPTGPTTTKTPTPAPTNLCPSGVEVLGTSGDDKILDTGWTGIAHNQPVIQDSKLSFALQNCNSPVRPCGTCTVSGPIPNPKAGAGDLDSRRCSNDTSTKCSDNTPCGTGTCVFFFGAPLPLSAGGVSTCVTNQVDGAISGTANVESGDFASQIKLKSSVFLVSDVAQPCPLCVPDATVNDGVQGGTCSGGPGYTKNGAACDGNGRSTLFGTTSFDCPPSIGTRAAVLSIDLTGSSSVVTKTLDASSPTCSGAPTKKCFCPAGSGGTGEPTRPNACTDDSATPENEGLCIAAGGSNPNKGKCPGAPIDQTCQHATYTGCITNADCPTGDPCVLVPRACYLDNGVVGNHVSAVGMADSPVNGESDPTFASLFCIPLTGRAAIDAVAGLPGMGRIELPLHAKEIPAK